MLQAHRKKSKQKIKKQPVKLQLRGSFFQLGVLNRWSLQKSLHSLGFQIAPENFWILDPIQKVLDDTRCVFFTLFVLYFGVRTLQKKAFSIQNNGHLGSRYIYRNIPFRKITTNIALLENRSSRSFKRKTRKLVFQTTRVGKWSKVGILIERISARWDPVYHFFNGLVTSISRVKEPQENPLIYKAIFRRPQ